MPNNPVATKWNPIFDNVPTSDTPRIRFSQKFSKKYLGNNHMILEIGCGIGSYTRLIDCKGCFALDLDINAVKIAKRYCKNTEFLVASALELPFREETFNLICMWGVFEEIPNGSEKHILKEINVTLTPKGVLLLSVYTNHFISKVLDPAFILRGVRHYDQKKFLELVTDCGLFIDEYTIRGGVNTIISNFLVYFYKHILKKKEGKIKNYFDNKSHAEIDSAKKGLVYMYIAANKNPILNMS